MPTIRCLPAALFSLLFALPLCLHAPHAADAAGRLPDMREARAAHQATLLASGDVLITGGCADGCDRQHASAEILDVQQRRFIAVSPMNHPRASHRATRLADGRVLITGGWSGSRTSNRAEIHDPQARTFRAIANMQSPRAGHAAVLLPDGRVLLFGGEGATGEALSSAELFDPVTMQFTPAAPMHVPRSAFAAVQLADGRILAAGGHRARGALLRSAEIYDPQTGRFIATGDMLTARHKHGAILLADGRVLFAGGSNEKDFSGRFTDTEIYDPAKGTFSPGPDMQWPRHKIRDALALLPSGRAIVAGGARVPEMLDATASSFTACEVPVGERMFATATQLPQGVLVLGGYDSAIESTRAAWLIDDSCNRERAAAAE